MKKVVPRVFAEAPSTFWKYQCIDTMKISRDKARSLPKDPKELDTIDFLTKQVADMGANCVAIGTPYDDEFVPFLTDWVNAARKYHLHVWFRGNFSSWEGWFDYPRNITSDDLLNKAHDFILAHPDLFQDGDIFTAAPEAENGWPGNYVPAQDYAKYRSFLIDETNRMNEAFSQIHKNVETNWLSMSGGIARDMFDQATIDAIGKKVTIDHYVKSPTGMDDYINYFVKKFHTKVIIGEFGAPIPDFNGTMDEQEQAQFVDKLLNRLYAHSADVYAINYWVLQDGSTALLHSSGQSKQVVEVIKKYFMPAVITGHVVDSNGRSIKNVRVQAGDRVAKTVTNSEGNYRLLLPTGSVELTFTTPDGATANKSYSVTPAQSLTDTIVIAQKEKGFWYQIQMFFLKFFGIEK